MGEGESTCRLKVQIIMKDNFKRTPQTIKIQNLPKESLNFHFLENLLLYISWFVTINSDFLEMIIISAAW